MEPSQEVTSPGSQVPREGWLIKLKNGKVLKLKDLVTLQNLILERKVTPEDEISKSGESWKPLGSIAEFSCFFQAVEGPLAPDALPAVSLVSAVVPDPTGSHSLMPRSQPRPNLDAGLMRTGFTGELALPGARPAAGGGNSGVMSLAGPLHADPHTLEVDDPVVGWQRSRKHRNVVVGLMATIGVVLIAVAVLEGPDVWTRIHKTWQEPPPAEALAALDQAWQGWLRSGEKDLVASLAFTEQALRLRPEWPDAWAAMSLAHTLLGQSHAEERLDLMVQLNRQQLTRPPSDPEGAAKTTSELTDLKTRLARAQAEEAQHFKQAFFWMQRALERGPEEPWPALAAGLYYVARNVPEDAQPHLERAQRVVTVNFPDVLLKLVAAESKALDPATRAKALQELEQLAQAHPDALVVRYRLAALLAADHAWQQAATHASAVLAKNPTHERCRAILAAATLPPEPSSPGGARHPLVTSAPGQTANADADAAGREASAVRKTPASRKWDKQLADADRLKDQGQFNKALALYKKLAAAESDRPEPLVGMGWCYLETQKMILARRTFERALTMDNALADAHLGLGKTFEARRDAFNAIKHYQRYLVLQPSGKAAETAKSAISRLREK